MPKRRKRTGTLTVYTLRDCRGAVRYVGLTSSLPLYRLKLHRSAATLAGEWVRSELRKGNVVTIFVEEQFNFVFGEMSELEARCNANHCEKQYIVGYSKLIGDALLNIEHNPRKSLLQVG